MILSLLYTLACRLLQLLLLLARGERSKELEILVLRHELAVLRRQQKRPQFSASDRLLLAALSTGESSPGTGPTRVGGRDDRPWGVRCES